MGGLLSRTAIFKEKIVIGQHGGYGLPSAMTFPTKLYKILQRECYLDAVAWLPDGRAFQVADEEKFMEIVPKFFKQTKISSFYRQLYLWGFRRMRGQSNTWHNEFFVRGCLPKMQDMIRMKAKSVPKTGNSLGTKSNTDFHALSQKPATVTASVAGIVPAKSPDYESSSSVSTTPQDPKVRTNQYTWPARARRRSSLPRIEPPVSSLLSAQRADGYSSEPCKNFRSNFDFTGYKLGFNKQECTLTLEPLSFQAEAPFDDMDDITSCISNVIEALDNNNDPRSQTHDDVRARAA